MIDEGDAYAKPERRLFEASMVHQYSILWRHLLPVHLAGSILVHMACANPSIIFILETNRYHWLGVAQIVVGLVEAYALNLSLLYSQILRASN